MSDITELSNPLTSVRFKSPGTEPGPCHFHTLTDEFIIEVGKCLLPNQTKSIPSCYPHFENYQHPFDLKLDYNDYLSFREACYKTSYLLKPIQKDLEIEIKSKASFQKWLHAPQDVLSGIIRLRLNVSLDPEDDLPQVSTELWDDFIILLQKLPNLLELYLTETPFCCHGSDGQKWLFEIPEETHILIETFAIEVKCRCCAEHLIKLTNLINIKHLKCTSDDSVNHENLIEPYDFLLSVPFLEDLETLYLKWWELDMFGDWSITTIRDVFPELKKLFFSTHSTEFPYTLCQRVKLEGVYEPNDDEDDDGWGFWVTQEEGTYLGLGSTLEEFAHEWSICSKMQEVDYGFLLDISQYTTDDTEYTPSRKRGGPPPEEEPLSPEQSDNKQKIHPDEYTRLYKEAIVAAAKAMEGSWLSLKKIHFWQDVTERQDCPTRDYIRWTANIASEGKISVTVDRPQRMDHDLTWSNDGTMPANVEGICDGRSP
ncbi:uncharacterized protein I206_106032 [Kwoniella pini CBS 10737]|uniref:Uncharacterized protein n=1 Tax=Kwoniella pini CBS 10737 TaxID=1296096 RepID=A0A1B9I0W6_9TREE|nr:uncharacterized protein I206_04855 [Kwoniella pini CBS 10737]OCF49167.1 hypothetical protein I206_04855 [Kwoniella pini CBS 10737]